MCGLLAMHTSRAGGFLSFDKEEFKQMLVLTAFRGTHSTGVAGSALNNVESSLVKCVSNPFKLFEYARSEVFFERMEKNFKSVIGHCRYATIGAIDAVNAHPFKEKHIVLAHNGTIRNFELLKDKGVDDEIKVDSHLIARLFARYGAEKTLPRINGAFVFMWIDEKEKTFNLARNTERPMFAGVNNTKNQVTFSSEKETLIWNSTRNKTILNTIEELSPNIIYSYSSDSIIPTETPFNSFTYASSGGYTGYKQEYLEYRDEDMYGFIPAKIERKESFRGPRGETATKKDKTILTLVVKNCSVSLGDEVIVGIDDYKYVNGSTLLDCTNSDYPNVIFKATYHTIIPEQVLYNNEGICGIVNAVNKLAPNEEHDYVCRLTTQYFVEYLDDSTETVVVHNLNDDPITLPKDKVKEMLRGLCYWCNTKHDENNIERPSQIMYEDYKGGRIICSDCAVPSFKDMRERTKANALSKPQVH